MPSRVVWSFHASDRFSGPIKKMQRAVVGLKSRLNKLNTTMQKTAKRLKKIGQGMKKVSLAAGLAVAGSLKAFGDMEQGVTNVLTLLDDKQIDKFGGRIDALSKESLTKFGFSTEETTQALFNNISALGTTEQSFEAFAAAQKLAIGGVTSLDTAVSGIAAVMNAYGEEASDATEVANAFFAAQKMGTTDVTKLASNIGKVAPQAKSAGIGFKELLATMAQLTQGGLSTEEASTSLKGVITSLLKPSAEAAKILDANGVAYGATALRGQKFAVTLGQIQELAKKNPDLLAAALPNIRAFTAAAALGSEQLARIAEIEATMEFDQLTPAFNMQMQTFNKQMSILWGNVKALGIEIGSNLAPAFLWLGGALKGAIEWFRGLSDKSKQFISWGLVLVAVLSTVIIAIAGFIGILGFGLAATGATIAGVFGFLISIPALVVAAFVAAVAAIWIWWDEIKGIIGKVWDFIGLGGGADLSAELATDLSTSSKTEVAIGVTGNKADVDNVKIKTTGDTSNLKTGVNLEN